jgi:DNA repair protein RecN (Recombination protein N)
MLRHLRIQNLAVVEDVTLSFEQGLNVLTGSTGTGKSLILGAVNLLLGERASTSVIRAGEDRAVVEGEFVLAEPVFDTLLSSAGATDRRLLLRREVHRNGRGHAFAGGSPCTLKQLRELAAELIEPHGQNEQLQLKNAENHVVYLDKLAANERLLQDYRDALSMFHNREAALQAFEQRVAALKDKKELLEHRLDEIGRAEIQPDEKQTVEQAIQELENAQDIYDALRQGADALYENEASAFGVVSHERARLAKIAALSDRFKHMVEQVEQAEISLKEAAADMRSYLDGFDFDPGRLASLQERLSFLSCLERRYGRPLAAIVEDQAQWKTEIESIAFEDEERDKLHVAVDEALDVVRGVALRLSDARSKAARKLDRAMTEELAQLMMKGARFRTDIARDVEAGSRLILEDEPVRLGPDGIDVVIFHVLTNPGESEGSVTDVASSGELSRIALALKKITSAGREGGVLVFDELDAGIGADLGQMIADKLDALSNYYQIICITHMAQIAARGKRHLVVRKKSAAGRTVTNVSDLDGEKRLGEIARMLGGDDSARRVALAEELLSTQGERSSDLRR